MKIALFATNFYPTPPTKEKKIYAPLWITYYLAKGLAKKGHQIFLFASSDSKVNIKNVRLISNNLPSLRKNKTLFSFYQNLSESWKEIIRENYELFLISKLYQMAQEKKFDIIQFHSKPRVLYMAQLVNTPTCFTLHDPLNYPIGTKVLKLIYNTFEKNKVNNVYFISISNAQRKPLPTLNYASTIYHGIDIKKFSFSNKRGDYLAFAGRILPRKGVHLAVQIAKLTGKKLKIAGEIPSDNLSYWNREIKPYLSKQITYEGMLTQKQMVSFYQKAEAFLMPILWEEPFGLVMIEAMACGTPVIAFKKGSVPEIVKNKKTGFVVKNLKEMVQAVRKIDTIKRIDCRKWVEENFPLEKMVADYEKVYYKILGKKYGEI
ncbi:glycosyltransferase family 4 protein [bacterium]|nr:glycosyltransferase family 4 protein [bacterium]